jgi:hypothetical protein
MAKSKFTNLFGIVIVMILTQFSLPTAQASHSTYKSLWAEQDACVANSMPLTASPPIASAAKSNLAASFKNFAKCAGTFETALLKEFHQNPVVAADQMSFPQYTNNEYHVKNIQSEISNVAIPNWSISHYGDYLDGLYSDIQENGGTFRFENNPCGCTVAVFVKANFEFAKLYRDQLFAFSQVLNDLAQNLIASDQLRDYMGYPMLMKAAQFAEFGYFAIDDAVSTNNSINGKKLIDQATLDSLSLNFNDYSIGDWIAGSPALVQVRNSMLGLNSYMLAAENEIAKVTGQLCQKAPLSPKLSLSWDNVNSGPVITFQPNSTGEIPTQINWNLVYFDQGTKSWGNWATQTSINIKSLQDSESFRVSNEFNKSLIGISATAINECGQSAPTRESANTKGVPLTWQTGNQLIIDPSASEIYKYVIVDMAKANSQSLTCTKGKIIKKIIGANPKCPNGYRVKA